MHRPSDERGVMWLTGRRRRDRYEDVTKLTDGEKRCRVQTKDSIFPFVPVQLKRLTKTHPCWLSVWCVCFSYFLPLMTQQALRRCYNGAVTVQTFYPSLPPFYLPTIPGTLPDIVPVSTLQSFIRPITNLLPSSLWPPGSFSAQFTSGRLKIEISAAFVCQRLDSFLSLMTRLVINGW